MIKKTDIILACSLLILSFSVYPVYFILNGGYDEGKTVKIIVDGNTYGEYPLNEDRIIEAVTNYGINIIEIKGESVTVTEADCPDGYCMNYGSISGKGGTIICLPHRLIITIMGTGEEIDAYVQ